MFRLLAHWRWYILGFFSSLVDCTSLRRIIYISYLYQ